ncbi:unnamed protein product [Effrenium voratum]|nr:unnamed protein product [Effrenium voratum]
MAYQVIPAHDGLPDINLLVTSDPGDIEDFLSGWEGRYHFGLDMEWKPSYEKGAPPNRSALLTICNGPWVLAVDLVPWRKPRPAPFFDGLWSFLENESHTFYGMGLAQDLARLAFEFDCLCDGVDFALRAWREIGPLSGGLTGLANRLLGTTVEQQKSVTRSNWDKRPLSEKQLQYLAEDAYLSWKIAARLFKTSQADANWLVTMDEMYGNGKQHLQHHLYVKQSVHDWSEAEMVWNQKQAIRQEEQREKQRVKEQERKKRREAEREAEQEAAEQQATENGA